MAEKQWHPGELLEISGNYWKTGTLHAAVKLDVFTAIGEDRVSARELADRLNTSRDGLERLLDALCALQLLRRHADGYENTRASLVYLVATSPDYIGWMIMHHYHLVDAWHRLDEAVVSGAPAQAPASEASPEWREAFLKGMQTNARLQAPFVVEAIDLKERKKMLDLGGGPATYAIHFCRANPGLSGLVFDLPDARPVAEANIRAAGLSERIGFQAGDFHKDTVSGRFDVVWLSHILHGEGPADAQKVIDLAVSALEPGGVVLIHDFILDDSRDGPEFPALFSLNMLVATCYGRAYSESEIKEILSRAGMTAIERLDFRGPTDSGIISGTKA